MNVHRYYLTSSANIALIQSWSIKQLATNKRARAVVRARFSFAAHLMVLVRKIKFVAWGIE